MRSKTIFIMWLTLLVIFAAQCQKEYGVPDELIGIWVTDDPDYSDRPFEIKRDTVIFELGLGYFDFDVFPIANVEKIDSEERILYTIYYLIPSGIEFQFSFYYTPTNGGEIRFKNQPEMRWTKEKSQPIRLSVYRTLFVGD